MNTEHKRSPRLSSARQVREQNGGISEVTLWRRINDSTLNFPQPVKICGRNFWDADVMDGYVEQLLKADEESDERRGRSP